MSSISIFPCKYTPAATVVDEVSSALELQIYTDDDLIAETSAKCNIKPEMLQQMIYGKTSVFNQFTLDREIAVNKLRFVLAEKLSSQEQYLFYGFLSLLVPQRITHVLRVLVIEEKQSRIDRAVQEGLSPKEAKRSVRNHDVQAYNWTDFLFNKEAYDKELYDLIIPSKTKNPAEITEEIVKKYHTTSLLRTAQSQKAVEDMVGATEIEKILLQNGHKVALDVAEGVVKMIVQKSVFSFSKLTEELTKLAEQVKGVKEVKVLKGSDHDVSIYRKQKFELPSKVLFVDDEKEFVQTVSQRLISRDVGTYGVFSGEEALDLISEDRPDVMVLDLKMPGLHGVEVLRRTKEVAPEVEVIILTGHGTSEDMEQCMKLGAFAYMNKPVDIEELSETIKQAHSKRQS